MLAGAARPERPERLSPLRPPAARSRALTARATLPALLAAAALLAGCGGDDEPRAGTTRELPDLAIPTRTQTAPPVTQETAPPAATTVDPATETLPEEGPPPESQPPADTPEND